MDKMLAPGPPILDMADQAGERTGDLAALAAWLLSFAPARAVEELAFLYEASRSYAQSALTIQSLDRILADPDADPWPLVAGNTYLMAELIEWRLQQVDEGAEDLRQLHALLTAADEGASEGTAATSSATASNRTAPGAGFTPLLRLAERAAVQVSELAALVSWLSSFAPVTALRELETMTAITKRYREAVFAIQDLDALLTRPWRSPREHVRGDLSIVLVLIDYRITRGTIERPRLEQVKAQILDAQRLEILAADRRRQMQMLAEDRGAPAGAFEEWASLQ